MAAIDRFQQCWKTGLARRKLFDVAESAGLCSAMVGGITVFPALLPTPVAAMAAGAAMLGGLVLVTGSILLGRDYPNRPLPQPKDALTVMNYRQQFQNGGAVDLENIRRSQQKVEDFKKTLETVRQGPPQDAKVVREAERVVVGGVSIPVRAPRQTDAPAIATPTGRCG